MAEQLKRTSDKVILSYTYKSQDFAVKIDFICSASKVGTFIHNMSIHMYKHPYLKMYKPLWVYTLLGVLLLI